MLSKPLVLAILTACSVGAGATAPEELPGKPPIDDEADQHFCCSSIDANAFSGDGCVAIGKENINTCDKVLYCGGTWKKEGGRVVCE